MTKEMKTSFRKSFDSRVTRPDTDAPSTFRTPISLMRFPPYRQPGQTSRDRNENGQTGESGRQYSKVLRILELFALCIGYHFIVKKIIRIIFLKITPIFSGWLSPHFYHSI